MNQLVAEHRLKNMVAWDVDPILCQTDIDMLMLACRRVDSNGNDWTSTLWVPTYHLEWGAAEAWAWKAGAAVDRYKVVGDGTELNRQQVFEHCRRMHDLYDKLAANKVYSIRAHGNTVEDRLGAYATIPWWYELAGN